MASDAPIRATADTVLPARRGRRTATTFHGLSKLPLELQLMIWKWAGFIEPHTFHVTLTSRFFKFDNEEELPAMPVVFSVCRMSRMAAFETFRFVDVDTNEVLERLVVPRVEELEEEEEEDKEEAVYWKLQHSTADMELLVLIDQYWDEYLESLKTGQDVEQTGSVKDGGDMESEEEEGGENKEKPRPGFLEYLRSMKPSPGLELLMEEIEEDEEEKADEAKAEMHEIEKVAAAVSVGCVVPENEKSERPKPRYFYVNFECDTFYLQFGDNDMHHCYPSIRPTNSPCEEGMETLQKNRSCGEDDAYTPHDFPANGIRPNIFTDVNHLAMNLKFPECTFFHNTFGYVAWSQRVLPEFLGGLMTETISHFPALQSLNLVVRPENSVREWWKRVSTADMEMKPWIEAEFLHAKVGEHSFGEKQMANFNTDIDLWILEKKAQDPGMKMPAVELVAYVPKDFPDYKGNMAHCGCRLQQTEDLRWGIEFNVR